MSSVTERSTYGRVATLIGVFTLLTPTSAFAYIGPGAGFAFLGSTAVFFVAIGLALLTLLLWPLQYLWRYVRGIGIPKGARTKRIVIVGLDGLEPKLVDQYMADGKLPNLKKLSEQGSYSRLGTTLPPLSPVAWSTFQTGVNPGAHNIFDFLTRDKRSCLPELGSTAMQPRGYRISLGPIKLFKKPEHVVITRRSQPFWKILGKKGIPSNIIRVPISYPPEKFEGNILSAMCTPDLRGTQGTFTLFTTRSERVKAQAGGEFREVTREGNTVKIEIQGPPDPRDPKTKSLTVQGTLTIKNGGAEFEICGKKTTLNVGQFSGWIELEFSFGRKTICGITRVCLREVDPHVTLYVSPINANPEKPALPIAEPVYFAGWLSRLNGLFGTLGLMEDTWGRNELALDDERFLQQAWLTHQEREKMFFETLQRTPKGVCACVFDASDRIQHMFWRYLDPKHPSPREDARFENTIPEMYQRMDGLVGRVVEKLNPEDVLIVLSDHGFSSFRRGINLNTWLLKEGYLTLKDGAAAGRDYFQDVDWSKTRAFAVGLTGLYINRKGRERFGIVEEGDASALAEEIARKLETVRDPKDDSAAIKRVYQSVQVYRGLYRDDAPDLIVGYSPGYRVSWDSVTGTVEADMFTDNLKAWSGDHQVDPSEIPGILFTNIPLKREKPHIVDMAPTVLSLFDVPVPKYMEGSSVL